MNNESWIIVDNLRLDKLRLGNFFTITFKIIIHCGNYLKYGLCSHLNFNKSVSNNRIESKPGLLHNGNFWPAIFAESHIIE